MRWYDYLVMLGLFALGVLAFHGALRVRDWLRELWKTGRQRLDELERDLIDARSQRDRYRGWLDGLALAVSGTSPKSWSLDDYQGLSVAIEKLRAGAEMRRGTIERDILQQLGLDAASLARMMRRDGIANEYLQLIRDLCTPLGVDVDEVRGSVRQSVASACGKIDTLLAAGGPETSEFRAAASEMCEAAERLADVVEEEHPASAAALRACVARARASA